MRYTSIAMIRRFALCLLVCLLLAAPPGGATTAVPPAVGAAAGDPAPRPRPTGTPRHCTADGAHCIAEATYYSDVCRTIDDVAREAGLDRDFFARLLWQESLFEAGAVSPAGAQGIAQFMPGTAALRGLKDAFNPAEALRASATYLAELSRTYGNLGLAAVAYNGGEARAARFKAEGGALPDETRGYVVAITGHSAETWRSHPPAALDLSLKRAGGDVGQAGDTASGTFRAACVAMALDRPARGPRVTQPPLLPWGVVVASNRDRDGAERQVGRLKNRHAALLGGETVRYTSGRRAGLRNLQVAQVGRASREEADALCTRLKAAGGDCMVLRN